MSNSYRIISLENRTSLDVLDIYKDSEDYSSLILFRHPEESDWFTAPYVGVWAALDLIRKVANLGADAELIEKLVAKRLANERSNKECLTSHQ
ncbi:hypothetical protein HHI36_013329 [Cryptolaemus montrouzieri]|uniref:Uncharacterized protein n=1 Tax=Cryptolaemus montrouzieri TaxID=559131 RepID=A0ABD2NH04_9CUCU